VLDRDPFDLRQLEAFLEVGLSVLNHILPYLNGWFAIVAGWGQG